jgi:cystathionine gamma-synthase/methionine-gamma-lyase
VKHIDTLAVHAGARADGRFYGTSVAIDPSSAFLADSVDELYAVFRGEPGVVYSRLANPTVIAFEQAVADLEGALGAVAFGSGMAAIHAAWLACGVGPSAGVVTSRDCYGSTVVLARDLLGRLGVPAVVTDLHHDARAVLGAAKPAAVHCETLSNPLLHVIDVEALARDAREHGARLVVDATFTTPILQKPLALGADIVLHSATKYLGGHGDLTGGVCATNDATLLAELRQARIVAGAVLSPFDAFLALRGIRTLPLRMARQCDNALVVARALASHPRIARVLHPALSEDRERAERLFGGRYGAMLGIEPVDGSRERAMQILGKLRLVRPATTLGDVASLALVPATSSHRELDAAELADLGIAEGLVRVSVGIEDPRDIVSDLTQAMD